MQCQCAEFGAGIRYGQGYAPRKTDCGNRRGGGRQRRSRVRPNTQRSPHARRGKTLPQVGDVSILGVVSKRGCQDFYSSHSDRVMLVEKMAETIAESIIMSA